jgi:hypothetical protein
MRVNGQRNAPADLSPEKGTGAHYEAGWDPGPVWTGTENSLPPPTSTGMQSPDCAARSELLYRLSYPSPMLTLTIVN